MESTNTILSRFFTHNTLRLMTNNETTPIMRSIVARYHISYHEGTKNEQIVSEIYRYLGKHYRNEYFFKNSLLNKLLINVHRINTTVALTELPIARSKADIVMINGKAVVYEIKTALDSFDRLETQLADYYKAFDHVCVVTSDSHLHQLCKLLQGSPVGIYVLTKQSTIRRVKEPEQYRNGLDKECLFRLLHKAEFEKILNQEYGRVPNTTPVHYYRECKSLISQMPVEKLYAEVLEQLKTRCRIIKIDFNAVPEALRFLLYFSNSKGSEMEELQTWLNSKYVEV